MKFRAGHLPEDRLFDCYLSEQGGEVMDPPAAEHLADCGDCRARYGHLRRFMDGLRTEADLELDRAFGAERLRAQQQQIARRLEHLAHPARVISFPGRSSDPHVAPRRRVSTRWLSAAAAAGVMLGMSVGMYFYTGAPASSGTTPLALSTTLAVPAASTELPASGLASDVEYLLELELALERPSTAELVAFDELTPHVREVRYELR